MAPQSTADGAAALLRLQGLKLRMIEVYLRNSDDKTNLPLPESS